MRKILIIPVLLAAMPAATVAQEQVLHNRIDFSVTAQREVENDIMIAVVFAEAEDNQQADAANEVNAAISWAADRARESAVIEAQTLQYSTRPVYAPNSRRITGWIARQELRLQSADATALSTALGQMQERVAIASMSQALSQETRDAIEEELLVEALARFNQRAELVTSEMGRDGYRLMFLNLNNVRSSQPAPIRSMVSGFASAEMAPPEIESGTQTLSVSASGAIELNETE